MKKESRESRIISLLELHGTMSISQLSDILDTSASTLRKQLAEMQNKGLIIRTYGGIMSVNPVLDESFDSKLRVDVAFLGCDAIDTEGVIYSDNLAVATSERAVIMNAKRVYILYDSSKISKKAAARITALSDCHALITGSESKKLTEDLKYRAQVIYA